MKKKGIGLIELLIKTQIADVNRKGELFREEDLKKSAQVCDNFKLLQISQH